MKGFLDAQQCHVDDRRNVPLQQHTAIAHRAKQTGDHKNESAGIGERLLSHRLDAIEIGGVDGH